MVGAFFVSFTLQRTGLGLKRGIFKEKRRMAFILSLYIAKGGLGVKVPWMAQYPCDTSSVVFFHSLISKTRRVYFSFFILFSGQQKGPWGCGIGIVLLACAHCVRLIYLHTEPPGVASDY